MSRIQFSGLYFKDDRLADNKQMYSRIISDPVSSAREKKKAQDFLYLLGLFPPGTSFQRLVAHRFKIFDITKPTWQRRGKLTYPKGNLELLVDLDLGIELMREDGIDLYEWVPKRRNVIHYKNEKERIVGTEYVAVLREESSLAKLDEFFEIKIDTDYPAYSLKIKKEAFKKALSRQGNPREIHFEYYVRYISPEHDIIFETETGIIRAGFLPKGSELVHEPHQDKKWWIPTDSKEPKSFYQVRFFKC